MFRCARFALIPLLFAAAACNRDPHVQSQNLVESGNKFANRGKLKEASIMYRRALSKDPKNGEGYYRLGLVSLKMQAYNDAASALRRAIELQHNNADAVTKLADLYWAVYVSDPPARKGMIPELEELSGTLLKRDPKSFDGLRIAGYLFLAKANDAERLKRNSEALENLNLALAKFEAANAVKPYDPSLTLTLASSLISLNRAPEAEKLGKELLDRNKTYAPMYELLYKLYVVSRRIPDAENILRQEVQNNPGTEAFRLNLARFYALTQRRADMEKTLQEMISDTKRFPMAHLSVGSFYALIKDDDRARREYEAGMAANPKEKATYQRAIAILLANEGKAQEALLITNEVLKADPKDSAALALRSTLSIQAGDPQQISTAVKDLQSLVSKQPQDGNLRTELGRALMAQGRIDEARVQFEEASRIQPSVPAPKVLLAEVYSKKGDYTRALALTDEVLSANQNVLAARLIRTSALLGLKDNERAKRELENLVKVAPQSMDAKYQLGYVLYTERNYKQAQAMFEDLQRAGDPRGINGLVETEVAQKDFKAAAALVESQLQKDPKRQDLRAALAGVFTRGGQYDEALKQYRILIANNPKSPEYELQMAETYRFKGDFNSAVEHFKRASVLAPNDVRPLDRLGMMLEGVGRRPEAKSIYEQIIRLDPDNVIALNNLAFLKAEEGTDLDQALSYAQRAKQKVPLNADISDTLGWIYIKKNLSDDAVRIFQGLVKDKPENATYQYHLAMALFQKGDRPAAKQACEAALKNSSNKDEQVKIRELMGKLS